MNLCLLPPLLSITTTCRLPHMGHTKSMNCHCKWCEYEKVKDSERHIKLVLTLDVLYMLAAYGQVARGFGVFYTSCPKHSINFMVFES